MTHPPHALTLPPGAALVADGAAPAPDDGAANLRALVAWHGVSGVVARLAALAGERATHAAQRGDPLGEGVYAALSATLDRAALSHPRY